MDANVAYMPTVGHISAMLNKIQKAGAPETFNVDFLKDLGFTSSNDRPFVRVLKYLGFLDAASRPLTPYREFLDHTKAKAVLATRMRLAYDDLFLADKDAHQKPAGELKGWFKTKTGVGDGTAEKMASTFRALAEYADWKHAPTPTPAPPEPPPKGTPPSPPPGVSKTPPVVFNRHDAGSLGLVYRIEIHLPDSQNVDTYRAIFKALKEELL